MPYVFSPTISRRNDKERHSRGQAAFPVSRRIIKVQGHIILENPRRPYPPVIGRNLLLKNGVGVRDKDITVPPTKVKEEIDTVIPVSLYGGITRKKTSLLRTLRVTVMSLVVSTFRTNEKPVVSIPTETIRVTTVTYNSAGKGGLVGL